MAKVFPFQVDLGVVFFGKAFGKIEWGGPAHIILQQLMKLFLILELKDLKMLLTLFFQVKG
jgi:hypothetical protein